MPEPKNPKPRTPRQKTTPKQPPQEKVCYIHDKVEFWDDKGEIRKNVCVTESEHPLTEFEGNHYCLFHLPTKEKDTAKFEEIFQARLEKTDQQCADIEAEFPDDEEEQKRAKRERNIRSDFRYVWFPSEIKLLKRKFRAEADFRSATFNASAHFSEANFSLSTSFVSATFHAPASFRDANFSLGASFSSATFSAVAEFGSAYFCADAYFIAVTFSSETYFNRAIFNADAYFSSANFNAHVSFRAANFSVNADFSSAIFSADAYFTLATFSADADFSSATFGEKSQIFFIQTKFLKRVDLNYAVFKGYIAFEGNWENRLFTSKQSLLDLQNARIDDSKKVSFHTVRLEPSWFVNTDASEFIFTDCEWYYVSEFIFTDYECYYVGGKDLDVKRELQNLNRRWFENPNALLTKACWQLADNHEESKSFAKSSLFRQIAHESRRLETPWYFQPFTLHWWYYAFSFYGERWTRAFVMLVLILVGCGVFYNSPFAYFESPEKKNTIQTEDPKPKEYYKMRIFEGIIHSLNVAALQRPEPKPAPDSDLTKAVVILETIFAPLQAALLALAIRRKFMR